jgi:hypothetical protein
MCRRIVRQHTSAYASIRTSAYASAGAAIMRKLVQRAPSMCRRIVYSRHRRVVLTILPSGEAVRPHIRLATRLLCQYLYFCTSKASKQRSQSKRVVFDNLALRRGSAAPHQAPRVCQYLYFCASKVSKLRTSQGPQSHKLCLAAQASVSICTFVLVKPVKQANLSTSQGPQSHELCLCALQARCPRPSPAASANTA